MNNKIIKNRLRQLFYRPCKTNCIIKSLDEIERELEKCLKCNKCRK